MEKWTIGKTGCVVTDNGEGFKQSTGHTGDDNIEYYGGTLICESIWREKDKHLISAAPDLLEAAKAAKAIFDSQGIDMKHPIVGEQYIKIMKAITKAEPFLNL